MCPVRLRNSEAGSLVQRVLMTLVLTLQGQPAGAADLAQGGTAPARWGDCVP